MAEPAASHLDIADDIARGLRKGEAVVALESTIVSHGMPYPENVETALRVERTVRDAGAIPATGSSIRASAESRSHKNSHEKIFPTSMLGSGS